MDRDNTIARLENIAKHAVHTAGEDIFILSLDDGLAIHEAIEALKAQLTHEGTTSDMISRQDALDIFDDYNVSVENGELEAYSRDRKRLCNLPTIQPEPQWIPVDERLPEAEYPVIVTWMNNDPASYYQYILGKRYTGVAHYKNNKWYWYSSVTEDVLMEYGRCDSEEFDEAIEVIAWMPLPEPYQKGATP